MRCSAKLGAAAGLALALAAPAARAGTWVAPATRPTLGQVVAVDATGEPGWLFGAEDVAGDGAQFLPAEQSIDLRTAYAKTDATRLWLRAYASAPDVAGADVSIYVFIDADQDPTTGGPAMSNDITTKFTVDPSPGGYEHVLVIGTKKGKAEISALWTWREPQGDYVSATVTAAQGVAELGADVDPIHVNEPVHGYLQAAVDLGLVGLTQVCAANFFFRSTNDPAKGPDVGDDLDVGVAGSCVPADGDDDGVPDIVVVGACTTDAQCPAGGACIHGVCVIPEGCFSDVDCHPGRVCTPDGRCVPGPGAGCTTNDTCGDLVCLDGTCDACTLGGAECGDGRVCAPTGICVEGTTTTTSGAGGGGLVLPAGDEVRGGACNCAFPDPAPEGALAAPLAALLFWARRRSRTRRAAGPASRG